MEEELVKKYIGKNADSIYDNMNKKGSFSVFCMLFTCFYFLYRKMYLIAAISFFLQYIIAEYIKNIYVSIVCFIIWGFSFYPLYKLHVIRKITKIKQKVTSQEDINNMCVKKGGTSTFAVIIIPIILIMTLIVSIGTMVFNTTKQKVESQNSNETSETNSYLNNGIKMQYDNKKWQQEYVETEINKQRIPALCEKEGDIVIICLQVTDINDGITDYSIDDNRQELYNKLIEKEIMTYNTNEVKILNQTHGFKELSKNYYYDFNEIHGNIYVRTYNILDINNRKIASLLVTYNDKISDIKEIEINEMLKTLEF